MGKRDLSPSILSVRFIVSTRASSGALFQLARRSNGRMSALGVVLTDPAHQ